VNEQTTQVAVANKGAVSTFDLSPRTFEQALTFAGYLADSDMVPKDFKGRPGNCLIAIQWGAELGLKPLQAMQNLAIINGRPSLWGDAVLALVRASAMCEFVIETDDGSTATCRVKRRGEPEQSRSFGEADARTAGLTSKPGPWTQYPKRMRQMRARAFALRDVFPDVLRGLSVAEEVMDAPPAERHMGAAVEVAPPPRDERPALPVCTDEAMQRNMPAWTALVAGGKRSPSELLTMLSTKATFSDEQRAAILSLKRAPEKRAPEKHDDEGAAERDAFLDEMAEEEEGGAA
jgi:hypothetical protein